MLTTRLDLEALLGAVLWTQRTNPNLTGAMRARLTDIENRLMDGITHCSSSLNRTPSPNLSPLATASMSTSMSRSPRPEAA